MFHADTDKRRLAFYNYFARNPSTADVQPSLEQDGYTTIVIML
jgi:hypothetical protein